MRERDVSTQTPDMSGTEISGETLEGGCNCGAVRIRVTGTPIVVNCCHCSWCRKETGSPFIVNAVFESERVGLLQGEPQVDQLPSASGKGQTVHRCPGCKVALWSEFGGTGNRARFVRVSVLDDPAALPPDVHVFAAAKQPWVVIPEHHARYDVFFPSADLPRFAREDSEPRWRAARGK
jgi:hypothetical protein